jgi:hypothetical protein
MQKKKGTQGVIQIENPNLVKAKNVKAKDVDVRPYLSFIWYGRYFALHQTIPLVTLLVRWFIKLENFSVKGVGYWWTCKFGVRILQMDRPAELSRRER